MKELNSKLNEAKKLTRKMDKSLALEYLWPEAFEHGRARAYWFGKAAAQRGKPDQPHRYHEFIITNSKGDSRSFAYEQVPTLLNGGLPEDQWRRITNLTRKQP
jgi:hypothetical protein